jgi:hypothetical protein
MVRDFIIWIDSVGEWEIRESGLEDYTILKPFKIDAFANVRTKDTQIVYISDIDIKEDDIKKAKKFEAFKDEHNFYINEPSFYKNTIQDKSKKFKGTFIDALSYIKKELNDR